MCFYHQNMHMHKTSYTKIFECTNKKWWSGKWSTVCGSWSATWNKFLLMSYLIAMNETLKANRWNHFHFFYFFCSFFFLCHSYVTYLFVYCLEEGIFAEKLHTVLPCPIKRNSFLTFCAWKRGLPRKFAHFVLFHPIKKCSFNLLCVLDLF